MLSGPKMTQHSAVTPIRGSLIIALLFTVFSVAQTPPPTKPAARPIPPARDPHTAGYVAAKELPDGAIPPATEDGNFIIGPTHPIAPENPEIANGTVF